MPTAPDRRISLCGSATATLLVALLSGCVGDETLRVFSSSAGGGDSSSSRDVTALEKDEDDDPSGLGNEELSVAECLSGSWEVDGPSYLRLFPTGGSGLEGTLSLSGAATVDFTEAVVTSTYRDWTVKGTSSGGDMTQVMNGVEKSQWSVDPAGVMVLTNTESTVVSSVTVSLGGQSMTLPSGTETEGLDLMNFTVLCEGDVATFNGPEGSLVLNRR